MGLGSHSSCTGRPRVEIPCIGESVDGDASALDGMLTHSDQLSATVFRRGPISQLPNQLGDALLVGLLQGNCRTYERELVNWV